jgi:hypothetical protein
MEKLVNGCRVSGGTFEVDCQEILRCGNVNSIVFAD